MNAPHAPRYTGFRYMTRFRCIGAACEASCCSGGWRISVDREHYEKTRRALGRKGRQEFDAKLKLVKGPARNERHHALVVLQDNGDCGFLAEDHLCSLQGRFGADVLSHTCSVYPRSLAMSGSRHELAGLTSCPEVARQLLLQPDAMDLVEVAASNFERPLVHNSLPDHPADPYERYHDELRNLMLDLLSEEEYPLSTRLSFVAYFANRTLPFFHRGVDTLDEERLLQEVERIQDGAIRRDLHRLFGELPLEPSFPSRVVLALINARSNIPSFRQLLDAALKVYDSCELTDRAEISVVVNALTSAYAEKKASLERFAPRIDQYFTNLAKNYWAREWYHRSPDLLTHTLQLLVRIAALRFLLLGHPLLAESAAGSDEERLSALDRAVVDTVQKFSRAFDHDQVFSQFLREQLASSNVISLAHAACLATF